MRDFGVTVWDVLKYVLIVIALIVLVVLVVAGIFAIVTFAQLKIDTDIIEIKDFSVGYLTESDYHNGNAPEASIADAVDLTVGTPCYLVIDFQIKAAEDNNGDTALKLKSHISDGNILSAAIQEASTGKIEILPNEDGSVTYEFLYTLPSNKKEEKNVQAVLKLVPNAVGEVTVDVVIEENEDVTVMWVTTEEHFHKTVTFRVG